MRVAYNVGNGIVIEEVGTERELEEIEKHVRLVHGEMIVER